MGPEPLTVAERSPDWVQIYVFSITPGTATTTIEASYATVTASAHQYEGGKVTFAALNQTFPVIDNDYGAGTFEINAVLTLAQIAAITLNPWGILKDDDFDSGLLPRFIGVTPFVHNAYSDAYVDVRDVGPVLNANPLVDFALYLTDAEAGLGIGWNDAMDIESQDDYWHSLVVAAYQASYTELIKWKDGDPDFTMYNSTGQCPCWGDDVYAENRLNGVTPSFGDWGSIIFMATATDITYPYDQVGQVVAHEVCHSAGDGADNSAHSEGGIMDEDPTEQDTRFTGMTLRRIRETDKW